MDHLISLAPTTCKHNRAAFCPVWKAVRLFRPGVCLVETVNVTGLARIAIDPMVERLDLSSKIVTAWLEASTTVKWSTSYLEGHIFTGTCDRYRTEIADSLVQASYLPKKTISDRRVAYGLQSCFPHTVTACQRRWSKGCGSKLPSLLQTSHRFR